MTKETEIPKPTVVPNRYTKEGLDYFSDKREQSIVNKILSDYIGKNHYIGNLLSHIEAETTLIYRIPISPQNWEKYRKNHSIEDFDMFRKCLIRDSSNIMKTFRRLLLIRVSETFDRIDFRNVRKVFGWDYNVEEDKVYLEKSYFKKYVKLDERYQKRFLILFGFCMIPDDIRKRIPKVFLYKCSNCGAEFNWFKHYPPNECVNKGKGLGCVSPRGYKYYKKIKVLSYDTYLSFFIRDHNNRQVECRVLNNLEYFENLKLQMDMKIEVQGVFHYDLLEQNRFLKITDVKILKQFNNLTINLGDDWQGRKELSLSGEGLKKLTQMSDGEKTYYKMILDVPFDVIGKYKGENEIHYEIIIEDKEFIKTKKQFLAFLEEQNLCYISGRELNNYIRLVIGKYEKDRNFKMKPLFNAIGIFERDNKLVVVYPNLNDVKVLGENPIQNEIIERTEFLDYDNEGYLTRAYYNIVHFTSSPLDVRLMLLGYGAISPFFHVLRNSVDVFPNFFYIGRGGTGKTTLMRVLLNFPYGTELFNADDVGSLARFTKLSTAYTTPMNIDDIKELDERIITYLKSITTKRGKRRRMTKNQDMLAEDIYCSYAGSSNELYWLEYDSAYRKRCLIFINHKQLEEDLRARIFNRNWNKIINGKIYGTYLLNNILEYIRNSNENTESSDLEKLERLIAQARNKVNNKIRKRKVKLTDKRRITVYTLIYIGLEFWRYNFEKARYKSDLLDEVLDLKNDIFVDWINNLEEIERRLSVQYVDQILEFFNSKSQIFSEFTGKEGAIILRSNFIQEFDHFARMRGYEIIGSMNNLGAILTRTIGREIKAGTKRAVNIRESFRGIEFPLKELEELRKDKEIIEVDSISNQDFKAKQVSVIQDKKIILIIERISNMIKENNNKAVEIEAVIEVLDLEDGFNEELIKKIIDDLIPNVFFHPKKREDLITFTKEGRAKYGKTNPNNSK